MLDYVSCLKLFGYRMDDTQHYHCMEGRCFHEIIAKKSGVDWLGMSNELRRSEIGT